MAHQNAGRSEDAYGRLTVDPTLLAFYRLSDGETVVQLVGEYRGRLTLCEVSTGRKYEVERAPFVADLRSDVVERVTPNWIPVSD